jgi:outer membrane lipoprotein-sorting protein
MPFTLLTLVTSALGLSALAAPAPGNVEAVMAAYRAAPAIEAHVKKVVHQEVMGTKSESEGQFYFSKGKLRLDFTKPERSTLVYDGRTIWLESRLDDKHIQVSRVKSGSLRKSNSLLAALFDRRDALKGFKLVKRSEAHGLIRYEYQPRDVKATEVRRLEVTLVNKDIHSIMYKDQMENQVDFVFQDLKRGPVAPAKFNYHPPRGASVTNL